MFGLKRPIWEVLCLSGSSTYSCASHPLQKVAEYVLENPPEFQQHIKASRKFFAEIGTQVYDRLSPHVNCSKPAAAWYTWVDFGPKYVFVQNDQIQKPMMVLLTTTYNFEYYANVHRFKY